jgi:competence protein ComEC
MPAWAFAARVAGGLWRGLWPPRARLFGRAPTATAATGALLTPAPDLLITDDGRHLAVVDGGTPFILRDRAGDYVRSLFAEASGFDGDPDILDGQAASDCSHDACVALLRNGTSEWRLLATRSSTRIDWAAITRACSSADIVVSDRRLPRGCNPRWLKLDAQALGRTGGLAIYLGDRPRVETVAERVGTHPWSQVRQ